MKGAETWRPRSPARSTRRASRPRPSAEPACWPSTAPGRTEAPDGLRLAFRDAAGVEAELEALVAVENHCCAWASWDVVREDGEVVMRARSTGDGVAALHGMFAAA